MRNLTSAEMFNKGYKLMQSNDYVNAEQWFLSVLYKYSKNASDYSEFLGSIDQLALYIYPAGKFQEKERALTFYKMFSAVDRNASLGYAYSLIKGVFEEPNYKEAIRQLSKAFYDRRLFLIAYLYKNGFGLEKNYTKAAYLLKHPLLKHDKQAIELFNSIEAYEKIDETTVKEKVNEIFDELFKNTDLELNLDTEKHLEVVNEEFFKNKMFIPTIDISTNEPEKVSVQESDKLYQKRMLERIFNEASHAPVFKSNAKYCIGQFTGHTPYIAYEDVMDVKYIIRATDDYNNKSESNPIIIEFGSLDELVNDGWRLD